MGRPLIGARARASTKTRRRRRSSAAVEDLARSARRRRRRDQQPRRGARSREGGIAGCVFHEVFGARPRAPSRCACGVSRPSFASESVRGRSPRPLLRDRRRTRSTRLHPDVVRMILDESRTRQRTRTSLHLARAPGGAPRHRARRGAHHRVARDAQPRRPERPRVAARPDARRARDVGALAPTCSLVHLTDARPDELAAVAAADAPGRLVPALEPAHRRQASSAARDARRRHRARRSAPTRSRRTLRSTCSPRRGRSPTASRACRRGSSYGWRLERRRARARASATTGRIAKGTRPRPRRGGWRRARRSVRRGSSCETRRGVRDGGSSHERRSRAPHLAGRSSPSRTRSSRCPSRRARSSSRTPCRTCRSPSCARSRCSCAWWRRGRARWPSTAGQTATSTRRTHGRRAGTSQRAKSRRAKHLRSRSSAGAASSRRRRRSADGLRFSRRSCSSCSSGTRYAKRFTWAAHAWLGVALALAPGGAWIACGATPNARDPRAHGGGADVALRLRRPLLAAGRSLRPRARASLRPRALRHGGRARAERRVPHRHGRAASRSRACCSIAAPPTSRASPSSAACSCGSTRSWAKATSRRSTRRSST